MSNRIELAAGQITETNRLSVELIRSADQEVTLIVWPRKPNAVSPAKLGEIVAAACRILSAASIEMAARRGRKRW